MPVTSIRSLELTPENNFDFLRLFAASLVLFSHAFPVFGIANEPFQDATQFDTFGGLAVAIFFVISGFLVTASWQRNPQPQLYLRNRFLRILPAYAVAIIFTALILGPALTALPMSDYLLRPQTYGYLTNLLLYMPLQYYLPGVFENNPYAREVNSSIWTLPLEFSMYLVVALLGVMKLQRGWLVALLYGLALLACIVIYETRTAAEAWKDTVFLRPATFFLAGATMWHFRRHVPLSPALALLLLTGLAWAANGPYAHHLYTLLLPYLVIFAALVPARALRNFGRYPDFSYGIYLYAFPTQQAYMYLIGRGPGFWTFVIVSCFITCCFAALSWLLVERPALKLKGRPPRGPA